MFNASAALYAARGPKPAEVEAYVAQARGLGGPAACLSAEDFAPAAGRLQELKHADHAAQLLSRCASVILEIKPGFEKAYVCFIEPIYYSRLTVCSCCSCWSW